MDKPLLCVESLGKEIAGQAVISGLNITLNVSDRTAIFAPSGAGKSTLVRILSGLELPTTGSVSIHTDRISTQFQEPRLFPFLTVRQNILLPFQAQGIDGGAVAAEWMREWLEVSNMAGTGDLYPYQLSGGMKQKVSFIRAIIQRPQLLILDEPFQSIDMKTKAKMARHLLAADPEMALLLITHLPAEVNLLAKRVLYFTEPLLAQQNARLIEEPAWFFRDENTLQ